MGENTGRIEPPRLGEPYLLTPGPLTTSYTVKQAMLRDWGSWDDDFRAMTAAMRAQLNFVCGEAIEFARVFENYDPICFKTALGQEGIGEGCFT